MPVSAAQIMAAGVIATQIVAAGVVATQIVAVMDGLVGASQLWPVVVQATLVTTPMAVVF
jgi:hypothetical protein